METSGEAVSSGAERADVTKRVTRTVISSSNYGTNAGDTITLDDMTGGDVSYFDSTDSYTTESTVLASGSRSDYSAGRLDRTQDDLSSFKKRIDANAEEQREQAGMMVGLQHKVEEYRRRIQDIEGQIANRKMDDTVIFNISEAHDNWTPEVRTSVGMDYEVTGRLDEERRRVEEFRMQNAQLQAEMQQLRQQFEFTLQDKERGYQVRERNLAQYLSDEQKRMMDLWAQLQQVRNQFSEYKDLTERELENQRNEFSRISRNVGGVSRQLNISTSYEGMEMGGGHDTELLEAVKRFRDQQTLPAGASAEDYDALMKKYEEAIERIVQLESRGDGSASKVAALEAELRRTKSKLAECQEVLHKMYDISKESGKDMRKRTRSASPGGPHVMPSEVLRSVRNAIRTRDNELQQLQRKLNSAQIQITELTTRFETAEEGCKRLEKQLADAKRDVNSQTKALDDANRELKRCEDRLRISENDRIAAKNTQRKLEEEIRSLKTIIDQNDMDGLKKALEDAAETNRTIEEEYNTRITHLTHRIEGLVDDNKRMKGELNGVKDKYRNLEIQYNTTLRNIDDKDFAIKNLENARDDLARDLEDHRTRFDTVTSELDHLQANYSTTTKNTVAIEMTVKEIKQQRDDLSSQKEDLSRQLIDIQHKMEIEIKKREDIEKAGLRQLEEIERMRTAIADYESDLMMTRRHNDELDTQVKTGQAKINTLESSVSCAKLESTRLCELNGKLQEEKNDIMSQKQKVEVELDSVKERVRKLEIEVEKLRSESITLHDNVERSTAAYKEEVNKVHLLTRELEEAKMEIDELTRRLSQFDQENKDRLENVIRLRSPAEKTDSYETTEITEIRVKELGDRHKMDVERVESERDDLMRRIQSLQDELAEKQRTIDRQTGEIDEMKHIHDSEISRIKSELNAIEIKYQNELDDEREQHERAVEVLKVTEEEMRNKITVLEKKLHDALDKEKELQSEITQWEDKYDNVNKELQKLQDEIDTIREDAEKEIQRWKSEAQTAQTEVKSLEKMNDTLKTQLNAATDRSNSLSKTVNEQSAKIRELNSQIRRSEEELSDAKATILTLESDLETSEKRLQVIEEQMADVQQDNNKLRSQIDGITRKNDVLMNTVASNESEIERLKKRVVQLSEVSKQQAIELDKLRDERDHLDKAYREKVTLIERLTETVKSLETKLNRMRQELQDVTERLVAAENERNTLRMELRKLEHELQFGRDQMLRKNDEFNAALDDLSNAHRVSEDGRVNALQELETRKFEISDFKSRLDNAEERLGSLQQEYIKVDRERDMLNDSLRRFQSIVSRTVIPESGQIDIQTIDVHVSKLMSRIEKLERERNDYRDSLGRLKRKTSGASITVNKHDTLYRSIEDRVTDVEEGKRSAEIKLASAKELLKSQEEALKQRDEERRSLKSKIVAFELETRGKDAQIRHLNDTVKTLKTDLESSHTDMRTLRDREEHWDVQKVHLLNKSPDDDSESRLKTLMATFDSERLTLNETVRKLTLQMQSLETKNVGLKEDADKLKRDLTKAERVESELRRSLDEQTRIARDVQNLKDQLASAQSELASANNRKQQVESELMNVRSDLRDHKQQLHDANARLNELQRQLQDANSNKNRLGDRIHELERIVTSQRSTESDLRGQLTSAQSERKSLQHELDELRRRIGQMEHDKKGTFVKIEEFKKIRITLIKKIEILETEKRSAEKAMSETAAQREAIERSLGLLERENKELARNCVQLQQQIAQLEMDNGNRLISLTNKQKEEHERFVTTIRTEKSQMERIVENRDRCQKNRIKQLESQLNAIREQLNAERLRRRDATDRVYMNDVSKISSAAYGTSSGMMSAGGSFAYPQTNSLDYLMSSSHRMMPSMPSLYQGTALSSFPRNDIYRSTSDMVTLEEPVDFVTSTYRSSARSGGKSTAQSTAMSSSMLGDPITLDSADVGDSEVTKRTTIVKKTMTTTSREATE